MNAREHRDTGYETMPRKSVAILICHSYRKAPYNFQNVSIIGRDYPGFGAVAAASSLDAKQKHLLELRSFWCRMWRLFSGDAFFTIEGIGSVIVAGPIVESMLAAWAYPRGAGTGSPLRAGMLAIGTPKENLVKLETVLQRGGLLVIVQGRQAEITAATNDLKSCA
jgi:hypothetical protein